MPRFVILEHDHPSPHFDLMIEVGVCLWSWRLQTLAFHAGTISALRNFDHRLIYLDYEGRISGNRGTVKQWDKGTFEWVGDIPSREAIEITVRLHGWRLTGVLQLRCKDLDQWEAVLSEV